MKQEILTKIFKELPNVIRNGLTAFEYYLLCGYMYRSKIAPYKEIKESGLASQPTYYRSVKRVKEYIKNNIESGENND